MVLIVLTVLSNLLAPLVLTVLVVVITGPSNLIV